MDAKGFDISKYISEHVYVYSGNSERIRLRTNENMIGTLIDGFGKKSELNWVKEVILLSAFHVTLMLSFLGLYITRKSMKNDEPTVLIKFVNGITFRLVFGNPHKSAYLRDEIIQIFEENYHAQSSSIGFDKTGKKIVLNLSMDVPVKKHELDDDTTVGVDLGLAAPVVCALNNDCYKRVSAGSYESFTRERMKVQAMRKSVQKQLKSAKGGHGRGRKFQTLQRIKERERRFAKNKNHEFSRAVIKFALDNNAKYINIEDLSGIGNRDKNDFVLRNWSYYELQTMIEYKAKCHGIIVRKINPHHTSQICSCCGHWEEGQRISQAIFICKNEACKNYGKEINADFNAARNIAMSKDFILEKNIKGKKE